MINLVEYARHEWRLGKVVNKAGESLRDTLKAVEIRTGRMPAEGLNPVDEPDVLRDLWRHFKHLNAARTYGFSAANPISELEIWAYCRNRNVRLQQWEVNALRRLDAIALTKE